MIGDSHQLQQVFLNIMNNAYDAVRETGRPARIEIKTASLGDVRGRCPSATTVRASRIPIAFSIRSSPPRKSARDRDWG